jgi:16S rRNA (adenine1518-N6/adenine1519-N6)-dimethyltransferase
MLVDSASIEKLVQAAILTSKDHVLEIGGGSGELTEEIAFHAGYVFAVEKDPAYASELRRKFASSKKVKVIEGNILNVVLPKFDKIVSNPPYSILQSFFLRLLHERKHEFQSCTIIVPYGFFSLITAKPGSRGFGTMAAFFYAFYNVETISEVDKAAFNPKPKVKSVILKISPREDDTLLSKILRLMFLDEERKTRNLIIDALWNNGNSLFGREMTKRESRMVVTEMQERQGMKSILEKRMLQLSNDEMSVLSASLLKVLSHSTENL